MSIEAMKQALEALHRCGYHKLQPDSIQNIVNHYIPLLEQAIAEAEKQKPYGYLKLSNGKFYVEVVGVPDLNCNPNYLPLHTYPQPKREPLTDEQILRLLSRIDECAVRLPRGLREFARAIEAAHGITSDMKQEPVAKTANHRHEE